MHGRHSDGQPDAVAETGPAIELVPVSEFPEGAAAPLDWSLALWGDHIPGFSRSDWIRFYAKARHADYSRWDPEGTDQELIWLAVKGGEVLGAIALVDFDDLEAFRHRKPWVAAFIVRPDLRGAGVGTRMLALLEEKARSLGIARLWLWTEDRTAFYEKRGYRLETHGSLGRLQFDLLSKDIGG